MSKLAAELAADSVVRVREIIKRDRTRSIDAISEEILEDLSTFLATRFPTIPREFLRGVLMTNTRFGDTRWAIDWEHIATVLEDMSAKTKECADTEPCAEPEAGG